MDGRKAYTEKEKRLLTQLVQDNSSVIESKRTDGTSWITKQDVWRKITEFFNLQPETQTKRDPKQLKKLWENIKQRKKKEAAAEKFFLLGTDGSAPKRVTQDPVMKSMNTRVQYLDVELENPWDSNNIWTNVKNADASNATISTTVVHDKSTTDYLQERDNIKQVVDEVNTPSISDVHSRLDPSEEESPKHEDLSGSVSVTSKIIYKGKRRKIGSINRIFSSKRNNYKSERGLCIKKLEEALLQQREIHAIKMEAARNEAAYYKSLCTEKDILLNQQHELHAAEMEALHIKIALRQAKLSNILKTNNHS